MCELSSKIRNDWLDGIFPEDLSEQHSKNRSWKEIKRSHHEVFILDPDDTEVLENKRKNVELLMADFVQFYIGRCIYSPLVYIAVMIFLSHFISGSLCVLLSLLSSMVTVVLHYLYTIIYRAEDEDEDEQ